MPEKINGEQKLEAHMQELKVLARSGELPPEVIVRRMFIIIQQIKHNYDD